MAHQFVSSNIFNQPIVEATKVKVAAEDKGMSNPTPAMLAVMEKKQLAKTKIYGKTAESDNLTRDVQVVVERLENTPGYKKILVSREEVINIDYINIIDEINIYIYIYITSPSGAAAAGGGEDEPAPRADRLRQSGREGGHPRVAAKDAQVVEDHEGGHQEVNSASQPRFGKRLHYYFM